MLIALLISISVVYIISSFLMCKKVRKYKNKLKSVKEAEQISGMCRSNLVPTTISASLEVPYEIIAKFDNSLLTYAAEVKPRIIYQLVGQLLENEKLYKFEYTQNGLRDSIFYKVSVNILKEC